MQGYRIGSELWEIDCLVNLRVTELKFYLYIAINKE